LKEELEKPKEIQQIVQVSESENLMTKEAELTIQGLTNLIEEEKIKSINLDAKCQQLQEEKKKQEELHLKEKHDEEENRKNFEQSIHELKLQLEHPKQNEIEEQRVAELGHLLEQEKAKVKQLEDEKHNEQENKKNAERSFHDLTSQLAEKERNSKPLMKRLQP